MNNQSYYYTRENSSLQPTAPQSRGTPPPPPPKKKKFDINKYKENTLKSLNEVECFLCNIKKITNSIKLYKILK